MARESWSLPKISTSCSSRTAINLSLLWATAFLNKAARRGSVAAVSSAIRSSTSSRCLYCSVMRRSWMASFSAGVSSFSALARAASFPSGADPSGAVCALSGERRQKNTAKAAHAESRLRVSRRPSITCGTAALGCAESPKTAEGGCPTNSTFIFGYPISMVYSFSKSWSFCLCCRSVSSVSFF